MRRFLAYPTAIKLWIAVISLISGAVFAVGSDIMLVQLFGRPPATIHHSSHLDLKAVPKSQIAQIAQVIAAVIADTVLNGPHRHLSSRIGARQGIAADSTRAR